HPARPVASGRLARGVTVARLSSAFSGVTARQDHQLTRHVRAVLRDRAHEREGPGLGDNEGPACRGLSLDVEVESHTWEGERVEFDLYVKAQSTASGSFVVPKTGA